MQAFVICDQERISLRVQQVFLREGQECPAGNLLSWDRAGERLAKTPQGLGVLVMTSEPEKALRGLAELRQATSARLLVVGPATDPKLVLKCLRLGASDFIDEEELESELSAALGRFQSEMGSREEPGQVIAVLGPSGGTGSSTLAVNIGILLAKEHAKALLVDMKLESGDLAALLDLHPTHSLADLCQNATRLDRIMFERSLAVHASGLCLLARPQTFAQVRDVTAEGVRQALTLARGLFPYVLLDMDHSFREEQLQALRLADSILLVFRLDFASLGNAHRVLDYLGRLGIHKDRVRVVVNRHGQPQEIPIAKAEEALGIKVFHFVPEDPKTVNRAINNGVPAVLDYPSAPFAKSVSKLAANVNGRKKG